MTFDAIADNNAGAVEISQASATEIAVNGAQQAICEVRCFNNLVTSGMTMVSLTGFFPVDVAVKQGQIIYLHAVIAAGSYVFTGIMWIRD